MKQGDIVNDKNGKYAVVYAVYGENVSLCIEDYDTVGDMIESDFETPISELTETGHSIYGIPVGTCNNCGNEIYKELDKDIDYPFYCPDCDENKYGIEVTLK